MRTTARENISQIHGAKSQSELQLIMKPGTKGCKQIEGRRKIAFQIASKYHPQKQNLEWDLAAIVFFFLAKYTNWEKQVIHSCREFLGRAS